MSRDELCTFPGSKIIKKTEAGGVLIYVGDIIDKEVWFYKDHIHNNSEIWKEGDEGTLVIPEYVALKKGLI